MMPVCDGSDFCKRLREDKLLSHIPFLLLTANSSETARIESYENGVDGYITKPFELSHFQQDRIQVLFYEFLLTQIPVLQDGVYVG